MVPPAQQPLSTLRIPVTRTSHRWHASRCVFDRIEAQPLEQVTVDSPSAFSKSMLLMIILGVLSFACLVFLLRHCCPPRHRRVVRIRSTRAPSPRESQSQPWNCRSQRRWSRRRRNSSSTDHDLGRSSQCAVHFVQPPQSPAGLDASPNRGIAPRSRHKSRRYHRVPVRRPVSLLWCEAFHRSPGPAWLVDASDALPSAVSLRLRDAIAYAPCSCVCLSFRCLVLVSCRISCRVVSGYCVVF